MSEQIIVLTVEDVKQSPDKVIDIIANLARRVTSLESQLRATQRNLETFAEQTESNTQDIAMLDERTYPKEEETPQPDESMPNYYAEMIMKLYNGGRQ
jgi:hypothetical protein